MSEDLQEEKSRDIRKSTKSFLMARGESGEDSGVRSVCRGRHGPCGPL